MVVMAIIALHETFPDKLGIVEQDRRIGMLLADHLHELAGGCPIILRAAPGHRRIAAVMGSLHGSAFYVR